MLLFEMTFYRTFKQYLVITFEHLKSLARVGAIFISASQMRPTKLCSTCFLLSEFYYLECFLVVCRLYEINNV